MNRLFGFQCSTEPLLRNIDAKIRNDIDFPRLIAHDANVLLEFIELLVFVGFITQ